jgi:pimeloyl-ACP methyl ester carboxylesterase
MTRATSSVIAVAVTALALALGGCGGDSSTDKSAGATVTPSTDATPAATRAPQPEGERLVDVEGHKMALRCQGQAAPTVVLETGAFPNVDAFESIMPDIARGHRVCSYDRSGVGKSEPGPEPRDGKQIALELDALLRNAGETGPFVLVSWSVGALYTPLYAIAHPDDVAGYVFIDPRTAAYQLRVGSDPNLPAYAAALGPGYSAELSAWDASATQVREAGAMPARPLVVLTAGSAEAIASGDSREGGYDYWRSSHADLAASVPGGRQIVVDNASHQVWDANPAALLNAINAVAARG